MDDQTEGYYRDKLRMPVSVFREIAAAISPLIQRKHTFYREPLCPEQVIASVIYRRASGQTYESTSSEFGMGRSSTVVAVRDVTEAILNVYGGKIVWPTG